MRLQVSNPDNSHNLLHLCTYYYLVFLLLFVIMFSELVVL